MAEKATTLICTHLQFAGKTPQREEEEENHREGDKIVHSAEGCHSYNVLKSAGWAFSLKGHI